MKRKFTSILSIILAILLSFGSFSVSALYITGDTVAAYKVKDSEVHVLGDGLTYNEFSYNDAKGVEQVCFTMEFNPKSSDFRTYVYHTKASYGYTIAQDAENAQKAGLQVYAAINGDFFSMDAANYGTPNNTYITEGKVMATSVNVKKDYKFIVAPDGTADVVESKPTFTLKIGSVDYTSSFGYINKRPITLEDKFYYFDNDCNATDPVVSNCSEIVCTYESGEISIGDTLTGTVKEVRSSGGSKLEGKNFVLTAGKGLDCSSIKAGDKVIIKAEESIAGSKAAVESAVHAMTARHVLVHKGVNRWANGEISSESLATQLAQRSVFGIKEDGTIVYFVCDGRRSQEKGTNGYNYDQIAEMMIALGCTEVCNLDGGGSTAAIISEGDGKFNYEYIGASTGRQCGNSVLIVRDPNADPPPEKVYAPIVDKENTELRNVAINKKYKVTWNGINEVSYLSSYTDDTYCVKMTNGKARPECTDATVSAAVTGSKSNMTYVFDLAKVRDDIRDVTFKGVSNSGDYGFKKDNIIVYTSNDKIHWSSSIDFDVIETATQTAGVYEYKAEFKESQSGQYVKIIIGTNRTMFQLDEIEINAMVDKSEPVEIPIDDPDIPVMADDPPESAVNVALGKTYVIKAKGAEVTSFYASTPETNPPKLTDGKLGTSGSYNDGCTLGFVSGTGKEVEITIDLGAETNNIEFVQLLNMINTGSFGHTTDGKVLYSSDGKTYKEAEARIRSKSFSNSYYNNLTIQLTEKATAKYVKVKFNAPKYLFGLGEVKVLTTTSQSEAEVLYGDINGDNEIDSIDASLVLKYDAGLETFNEKQLKAANVSGDGEVDSLDAALILKYDAGMIDEL